MAAAKKSLYEILGVSRDANEIDIGLAYEKRTAELQRATPPEPGAQSLLHEAYEVLNDPRKRAAYDANVLSAAEKAEAAQQSAPDLVLEGEEPAAPAARKFLIPAVIGIVLVVAIAIALTRGKPSAPPAPEPVAEAPKPVPPPPPKIRSAAEVLADAVTSSGKLLSYEMSGNAVPVGIASAVEPGVMVTTCHGIPAGAKLVVRVGSESFPADLSITDEELDLCKLAVAGFAARPLSIAAEDAKAGDPILVAGLNSSGDMAITEGTVKEIRGLPGGGKVLVLSMPIAPLGSGGAVFDAYGKVVGFATNRGGAGASLALPAAWLAQVRSRTKQ